MKTTNCGLGDIGKEPTLESTIYENTVKEIERELENYKPKNKFADKSVWPPNIEEGKQGKHIEGHPNFIEGKSRLTITMKQAAHLAMDFAGMGEVVGNSETSNKERVDFGLIIGLVKDSNGNLIPTTRGLIHHSKKGTHIVPSNPNGVSL